jgi:hypothetical protein
VAAVREVLTKTEGIPETRLKADEPATPPAPAGDPRVEFKIGQ